MNKKLFAFSLILIIVIPVFYSLIKFVDNNNKKETLSELLNLTEIIGASINFERFKRLDGSDKELGSEDYLRLREQFSSIGNLLKKRDILGIYAMKQLGDDIVFIVDSAPQDDPWHADIGVKYEEPPDELGEVFISGKILTTDKYTDEYGTFFSAFVPILDKGGSKIIGVVGADINYTEYINKVNNRTKVIIFAGTLLTLLIVAVYFLMAQIIQSRNNQKKYSSELEIINKKLEGKVKERTGELEQLNNSLEGRVKERTGELEKKMEELKKMNDLMIGRELKMVELKKEIGALNSKLKGV